ncbi:MAG: 16S rRNA (uracil(1498)-N(3))-methyltransferase [Hyphomicrobiaceae bacterium]|nr:16S rRNA (uracil(1498)-N(3))-methyltransferase [Hyphomicrobiaceae bacterium]MCC0023015.1 16S rRNA (uracil(1498)-N(3))-methyltransferase [Hyphomicrobiaceae bacterium]
MPRTHAKLPRLFVADDLFDGATLSLGKDHANYVGNVLRKREGGELVLFNGRQGAWLARLENVTRKSAAAVLFEQIAAQPEPTDLWYGFAPLKSARLDYMVQKATEMGASALQPVITEFTQAARINLDRARANVVEAAEQCEVLQVPDVLESIKLPALLEGWETVHADRHLVFADEAAPSASPVEVLAPLAGNRVGLLVGPEGGFSPRERDMLLAKPFVIPISLGPRILRADTAAVAALAVMQSIIGDWR